MENPLLTKRRKRKPKLFDEFAKRPSVGADLCELDAEKSITFESGEYGKRRTLRLIKIHNSWGFTLQTYGIKHKKTNEIEMMTYIDYVEIDGAAWLAGLQRGDVILAVNGEKVGNLTHWQLVHKIRQTDDTLRLIVHFEDCCKKVELHERFLKLKAVLRSKMQELREIEMQERAVIEKLYADRGLNRFDVMRQSIVSDVSSNSDSWDAYSLISSPYTLKSTGQFQLSQWSSVSSIKSLNLEEDSSIYEGSAMDYIDSDTESITFTANNAYNHCSDSDLRSKADVEKDRIPLQNQRLSRSFEAGLNIKSNPGKDSYIFKSDQICDHKSGHIVNQDKREHLVKYNEEEKSHAYTAGSGLRRNKSTNSDKIFYKGENGKMIVPKICIEGEFEYATFDHIDTDNDVFNVPNKGTVPSAACVKQDSEKDIESYQEKIIAMEMAKEMTKIEKILVNSKQTLAKPNTNNSNSLGTKSGPKRVQKSKSQPLFKSNSAMLKNKIDPKFKGLDLSPRLQRSNMEHVGGRMSYEKLKSSVPDIIISFHAEDYQIIYINEGNQQTKL